ncbi:MAG: patatin-like phospholipase family protein [bacterium]|nr:patatin-like phospholipase family protein [bacterium]
MFSLFKKNKIGLALGGGASRGIAHTGVIQVLQENNIHIDYIAGISAGSIIGGLLAAGIEIKETTAVLKKMRWSDFVQLRLPGQGLTSSKPIETLVKKNIGNTKFKDLKIPFTAMVTDILTGESVELNDPEMEVAKAIRASASFPGFYSPTVINNTFYCDGGIASSLPVKTLKKMGADKIIAIDVIPRVSLTELPKHFTTLADRSLDIILTRIADYSNIEADVLLKPVTKNINSFQLNKADELVELGRIAALAQINRIKRLVF